MENFNIMWVHWKIHFLGGVVVTKKTVYRVELPKTGELGQFEDLREGAWLKRGKCTLCRLLALCIL